MTDRAAHERGFTLIEMLVALTIFAMLSAAGVMLLGNAVSAQGQVTDHLEDQGGMLRVVSLIGQDMDEAVPRISRTESGLLAPAFFSRVPSDAEPFLHFVRGGRINMNDAARSDLQKVEYWLRARKLERRTYPLLDGAAGEEPAILLNDVEAVELSFRDSSGAWLDQWQQPEPHALPVAARMVITRVGHPPLTLIFAVGAAYREPEEGQKSNG